MNGLPDYKNDPRLLDPAVLRDQERRREEEAGRGKYNEAISGFKRELRNVRSAVDLLEQNGPNTRDLMRLQNALSRMDYWRTALVSEAKAINTLKG
jgi:hypothetical protein